MSHSIRGLRRSDLTHGIVQVSLDLKNIDDALRMAAIAMEAGADWLEIGTPLAMAEGAHAVRRLRAEYPDVPLIADLKIMDGGFGEAAMYAEAGADAVVVMSRAHDATIQRVCEAGEAYGVLVMGDDIAAPDRVAEAQRLERLGVGMVLHHIGHDHRNMHRELGSLAAHRPARHRRGHHRSRAGGGRSQHRPGRELPHHRGGCRGVRRPAGDRRRDLVHDPRRRHAAHPRRRHRARARDAGHAMTTFRRLHHASFTHPVGQEDRARDFYVGVLGLVEVPKPETMNRAVGAWFRSDPDHPGGAGGGIEIHAIPDADFHPNSLGHPAILVEDLDELAATLVLHGISVERDGRFPGHARFHTYDHFGNQLEFLQEAP